MKIVKTKCPKKLDQNKKRRGGYGEPGVPAIASALAAAVAQLIGKVYRQLPITL